MNKIKLSVLVLLTWAFLMSGCGKDELEDPVVDYLDKVSIVYAETDESRNMQWPDDILPERFAEYWYQRFAGESSHVWSMEAPHFQFMASPSTYRNYLARSQASLIEISINEIKKITEYKYQVICIIKIAREGRQHEISFSDRWVQVNGDWYHIIRDPIVFPFSAG
ncbi:hypothetical protein [Desulfonatronovibrio magnus]|uniref:hypothetical protein n=1 Tax=Desulfonatronovibrio magnus TaxID=698827 RepID=UPI0012F82692|nr:hypothetical protein [Desulfonatronovibrio magnus]